MMVLGKMAVEELEVDHFNDNQLAWALIGCRDETYAFLRKYKNKEYLEHIRVASFDPVEMAKRAATKRMVMDERLEILSDNLLQPMYAQSTLTV